MNKAVSKHEIKEVLIKITTGFNKFQCRCDSITCIFYSIYFFKTLYGTSYKTGKLLTVSDSSFSLEYVKGDLFHFFSFLGKNFWFTFKNLLVHLIYLKSVKFLSSQHGLSTFLT